MPTREAVLAENLCEAKHLWIRNGLSPGKAAAYARWIRTFRRYCQERGWEELQQLTLEGARSCAEWYARKRQMRWAPARTSAGTALHAWSNALVTLGISVPTWKAIDPLPTVRAPIVREFIEYRRKHTGVSAGTLRQDQSTSMEFLECLRRRKRTCHTVRIPDVDAFVVRLQRRMDVSTVGRELCSVRALLRFLVTPGEGSFRSSFVIRRGSPPSP